MGWIVVEEQEFFYASQLCNPGGLEPGTVAPAFTMLVLLWCELGVVDQDVGVLRHFQQTTVELRVAMLKIAGEDNLSITVGEAVA